MTTKNNYFSSKTKEIISDIKKRTNVNKELEDILTQVLNNQLPMIGLDVCYDSKVREEAEEHLLVEI